MLNTISNSYSNIEETMGNISDAVYWCHFIYIEMELVSMLRMNSKNKLDKVSNFCEITIAKWLCITLTGAYNTWSNKSP